MDLNDIECGFLMHVHFEAGVHFIMAQWMTVRASSVSSLRRVKGT